MVGVNILAINPWIVDYAAYDFWLKPYGFLAILTYLKSKGSHIDYIDCLEKKETMATFGRGKYFSQIIEKPLLHKPIPRYFKRYGITLSEFREKLKGKHPDYILITSSMTYWYPAIIEVVNILKAEFPNTPTILGGTYATLCLEHAKTTIPCDFIFPNNKIKDFFKLLNLKFNLKELLSTLPCYDYFYTRHDYIVLRTSWGCPFECSFCAIKKLSPPFFKISLKKIIDFIITYSQKQVKNFVLYDDAFLYQPDKTKRLLFGLQKLKINASFHTPNGLHLRFLDNDIARLLKCTGFINPHFGLETLNPKLQKIWGDKANRQDVLEGIHFLKQGGFKNGEFSIYLLLGYPNQNLKELRDDVKFLNAQGARVSLAEFSPVPGTKIFKQYKHKLCEPLLHNNSIFGFFQEDKIKDFWEIKNYVRQLNKQLSA